MHSRPVTRVPKFRARVYSRLMSGVGLAETQGSALELHKIAPIAFSYVQLRGATMTMSFPVGFEGMMTLVRTLLKRFGQSKAGNMAITFALSAPVVVGAIGLGVDTGYWYFKTRGLQTAADTAAFSATVEKRRGGTAAQVQAVALAEAVEQGFDPSVGSIQVNQPPLTGNYRDNRAVEVLLTLTVPRMFTSMFMQEDLALEARGVGHYDQAGKACALALAPEDSQALSFSGNSVTMLNECNLMSNSLADNSVSVTGASQITVPCIVSAGGVVEGGSINMTACDQPMTQSPPADDPYALIAKPPVTGPCLNFPGGAGPAAVGPGRYCGGGNLRGIISFAPGMYVIDGGTLRVNATAMLSGSGVTFYFTNNASIDVNGSATMTLSAPTSGPYAGMLFWGDNQNAFSTINFNGNAASSLTGVIYFPSASTAFAGSFSGTNGCLRIAARRISVSGSMTMNSECTFAGIREISIPGRVVLVE